MEPELKLCVDCKEIRTTSRDTFTDEAVCGHCSNARYFNDLKNGYRVELKLNMRVIRKSTLLKIRALLEEDEELFKNKR